MRRCHAMLATLVILASACRAAGEDAPGSPSTSDAAAPERQAATGTSPRPLATEDAGACQRDTVARHADPRGLVEEWVRRDAEGPMERQDFADAWSASALSCVGVATRGHREVISEYAVAPLDVGLDSARFLVVRQREYRVELDAARARLVRDRQRWTDTVLVVRLGPQGWRIAKLAGGMHALPGVALSRFEGWSAADSASLAALAARTRGSGGGA